MSKTFLLALVSILFASSLQAEIPHRNSVGVRASLGGYGLSLSSVQAMDEIGGELGTFSFQARLSKEVASNHQVQVDVTRYTQRALDSWVRSSRYRIGWGYGWQSGLINWSGFLRLAHRDSPGNQHQRAEISLQGVRAFGNWNPYLSGQVRYHLTDSHTLTRRLNLGTNYHLPDKSWTLGLYLRYGQNKLVGEWQDPTTVLGTSLNFRF